MVGMVGRFGLQNVCRFPDTIVGFHRCDDYAVIVTECGDAYFFDWKAFWNVKLLNKALKCKRKRQRKKFLRQAKYANAHLCEKGER